MVVLEELENVAELLVGYLLVGVLFLDYLVNHVDVPNGLLVEHLELRQIQGVEVEPNLEGLRMNHQVPEKVLVLVLPLVEVEDFEEDVFKASLFVHQVVEQILLIIKLVAFQNQVINLSQRNELLFEDIFDFLNQVLHLVLVGDLLQLLGVPVGDLDVLLHPLIRFFLYDLHILHILAQLSLVVHWKQIGFNQSVEGRVGDVEEGLGEVLSVLVQELEGMDLVELAGEDESQTLVLVRVLLEAEIYERLAIYLLVFGFRLVGLLLVCSRASPPKSILFLTFLHFINQILTEEIKISRLRNTNY